MEEVALELLRKGLWCSELLPQPLFFEDFRGLGIPGELGGNCEVDRERFSELDAPELALATLPSLEFFICIWDLILRLAAALTPLLLILPPPLSMVLKSLFEQKLEASSSVKK